MTEPASKRQQPGLGAAGPFGGGLAARQAQGPSPGKVKLSRRALLVRLVQGSLGIGTVAVLSGLEGPAWAAPCPQVRAAPSSKPSLPQLSGARSASTHAGQYVFRSRPDLKAPVITIDKQSHGLAPGLILTDSHAGPADQGPMIFDSNGDLVWFLDLSPGTDTDLRVFNVQVQSLAGKPVLTWFQGTVVNAHGLGHYELWGPGYTRVAQVKAQNGYQADLHDFVLTDKGTALLTCYGEAPANLSKFGGKSDGTYYYGVVQEVEVTSGKLLFEWRSDEHVPLAQSNLKLTSPAAPWDYFHLNSVSVDPTDGNLIISGRNTWAFYKLHRSSGKILWQLGGKTNDFKLGPGANFAFQHDVRRNAGGSVSLFDNEGGPPDEASQSRGLILSVDEVHRTAALLHQYDHSPPVMTQALGSVQELADGHRFIGWGESSYFTEYGANGEVILDGQLAEGTECYRTFKQVWSGQPSNEAPAMAVARGTATATVYASYNGCTDVAAWLVLGGPSASKLTPLGRATRFGFETAITVHAPPAYVAVEAIGSDGKVLARSAAQPAR